MIKKVFVTSVALAVTQYTNSQTQQLDCDWADKFAPTTSVPSQGNCVTANATHVFSAGFFNGTVDFNPGAGFANLTASGSPDMYINCIEYIPNTHHWTKQIGGPGSGTEQPNRILQNTNGVYVVGSFTVSTDFDLTSGAGGPVASAGSEDIFLAKYDAVGNLLWYRTFGSTGVDQGLGMALDPSGNIVICGTFTGTVDFDPSGGVHNLAAGTSGTDAFFATYSTGGAFISAYRFGDANTVNEAAFNVRVNSTGEILLCGYYSSAFCDFDPGTLALTRPHYGGTDGFVARYTTTGIPLAVLGFGTSQSDHANDLSYDPSGNIYFTGNFGSAGGGGTSTTSVPAGITLTNTGAAGTTDVVLAKLSNTCTPIWAQKYGGSDREYGISIEYHGPDNIYIGGHFRSPMVDFDVSATTANASSAGSYDIFYSRYNSSGMHKDVSFIGGAEADMLSEFWIRNSDKRLFSTGSFQGMASIDFDPDMMSSNFLSSAFSVVNNAFVAMYDFNLVPALALSESEMANEQGMDQLDMLNSGSIDESMSDPVVFPNPTQDLLNIQGIHTGAIITIYSMSGMLLEEIAVTNEHSLQIDLEQYEDGLYLIKMTSPEGFVNTVKITKQ